MDIELKDEELIFVFKDDYHFLYDVLHHRYQYLIIYLTNLICKKHSQFLFQEGLQISRIAFYKAITTYHLGGELFINYAKKTIKYALLTEVRRLYNQIETISLDNLEPYEQEKLSSLDFRASNDLFNPETYLRVQDTIEEFKSIIVNFTEEERKIWFLYIDGYTYKQIAEQLKIKVKAVDYVIFKLKEKIHKKIKV